MSTGLADSVVVAKVNDKLWDLDQPFEEDATLQLLKFEDDEVQHVFWHSSAHILGEAMESLYGGHLCYGPPVENGFFYDMYTDREVSSNDCAAVESKVKQIVKQKQTFDRLTISKDNLLNMFESSRTLYPLLSTIATAFREAGSNCTIKPTGSSTTPTSRQSTHHSSTPTTPTTHSHSGTSPAVVQNVYSCRMTVAMSLLVILQNWI